MARFSPPPSWQSTPPADDERAYPLPEAPSPEYLTDGTRLYRCLGTVSDAGDELIGLEDCRTLSIALVPFGNLAEMTLRPVVPAR
jgi:hypothetical protein